MRINRPTETRHEAGFPSDAVLDVASKVFRLSLIPSVLLTAWLLWGLFSGKMADVQGSTHQQRLDAIQTITTLSRALNISVIVTVLSGALLYWETEALGVVYLLTAALFAYGVQFAIDTLFSQEANRFLGGSVSQTTLAELKDLSLLIGVPGALITLRHLVAHIFSRGKNQDLANLTYGKGAVQEERKQPLIGALARCWELPFCRDGIRVRCPIFHAKTKCWKQRVGCMCEENIILLAMGGAQEKTGPLTKDDGFVPIGDLLQKNQEATRALIPTRAGPRGVRIPTNPHLTDGQKRERCRNCAIYNEHQRQKYQLLSAPVTLLVPVLVVLGFGDLQKLVSTALAGLDQIVGHLTFSSQNGPSELSKTMSGNLPIETMLIICLTLVFMTWAQRALEYCMFKIKI